MSDSRPNILLLMTDQQRGDALGINGHPVVETPNLDAVAAAGVNFTRAYTACPVCVPARRTLMTGQRPRTHGVFMNHDAPLLGPTLPGELAKAGYQTHLCGKLHLSPHRKRYGFTSTDWADGFAHPEADDDYQRFLRQHGITFPRASNASCAGANAWSVRPWHLDERFTHTNWCAERALDFMERRDPTMPFFLKVSFYHPHQPWCPPAWYLDKYLRREIPPPVVGDWARVFDRPQRGLPVRNAWRICLEPERMRDLQAAYYACINAIDDQVARLLEVMPRNTIIAFVSDHGEMLGDHQWLRKRGPYEGSARVPFFLQFPESMKVRQGRSLSVPVELMDLMPTLLEAAGVPVPSTVEGQSLLPLLRGQSSTWRPYLHGECSQVPTLNSGMQYLTDGRWKYIWLPGRGQEQLFDLASDPTECHDLSPVAEHRETLAGWRARLVAELTGRPEGFVAEGQLQRLPGATASSLPGV